MRRFVVLTLLALALLTLGGCGRAYELRGTPYEPVLPAPEIGGLQKDGTPFSLAALPQKVKLLFFGYTFCPDICPITLANMRTLYGNLTPRQRADVAVIFVSTDPERDTPERLKTYVDAFDPAFQGIHVPLEQLPEVKKGYGVYAEKRLLEGEESSAGYFVDHSAFVYVIDKDDELREIFAFEASVDDITADVQYLLTE